MENSMFAAMHLGSRLMSVRVGLRFPNQSPPASPSRSQYSPHCHCFRKLLCARLVRNALINGISESAGGCLQGTGLVAILSFSWMIIRLLPWHRQPRLTQIIAHEVLFAFQSMYVFPALPLYHLCHQCLWCSRSNPASASV